MRVSRAQAAENRERILEVATKLFREHGIDGIGVADLMKSAGLTHGGFYGHFKSKEDLVAQACGRAVAKMSDNWIRTIDHSSADPIETLASDYLAVKHRDNSGRGCPMAALGSEIARQGPEVRRAVTEEIRPFIDYLSGIVQGNSSIVRRERAIALYASLVGAIVIARAVDDLELSNTVLRAVANAIRKKRTRQPNSTSRPRTPGAKKKPAARSARAVKA